MEGLATIATRMNEEILEKQEKGSKEIFLLLLFLFVSLLILICFLIWRGMAGMRGHMGESGGEQNWV